MTLLLELTCYSSLHLQLQRGEQTRFALPHLHFEQSPLQQHLISWLHALDTSGIVIHTGAQELDSFIQPNSCGEGTDCCSCVLVVQIPA